jgi:periplasmic divalent cation tolerance protein
MAMRSDTTPGKMRRRPASTVRALWLNAVIENSPSAKPAASRARSVNRASLMSAMPAQAASTTQARTHQPSVWLRRTSTTASSKGKPSRITINSSRIARIFSVPCYRSAEHGGAAPVAAIFVLTNLPDSASAFNLARELVQLRLAACVNVLSPATSFYRWEGRLEQATEFPLLVKSTRDRYEALENAIVERHPYDVPEIVSWSVEQGLPAYLRWIEDETQPAPMP